MSTKTFKRKWRGKNSKKQNKAHSARRFSLVPALAALFYTFVSHAENLLVRWREAKTEISTGFAGYRQINYAFYDLLENTQIVTSAFL